MKKTVFAFLISCILLGGCSLKEDLRSYSTAQEYYKNPQQIITGLNGCYTNIRNIYNNVKYFAVTETQGDIIMTNGTISSNTNSYFMYSPSKPEYGATMWQYGYQGVMRANAMTAAIKRAYDGKYITEKEMVPLMAEAVVLRSLFYYTLTANFGDVPFYEEEVVGAVNDSIARLPRTKASYIRDTLISELKYWVLDRPEGSLDWKPTNSGDNAQQYRCGAAVGLYLGGKMALWEERWSDAIDFFGALEDIYGNGKGKPEGALAQYPLTDLVFSKRQIPESIFEISNIAVPFGLNLNGTLASYCEPYRSTTALDEDTEEEMEQADSDIYGAGSPADKWPGIGIPELGSDARTLTPFRPTERFYKELMPYESKDLRRAKYDSEGNEIPGNAGYMAWGWVGYAPEDDRSVTPPSFKFFGNLGISSASTAGTKRPYLGNKFWCFGMHYTMDSNSPRVFRFAGALLSLAEAWYHKEDYDMALKYLNQVRKRAGLDELTIGSFQFNDDILAAIQDECARELFGEFQRKHDLVRWGLWYKYVKKYRGGEANVAENLRPCHEYYPIPDEQITYSGGALDNKEYNKYGL